MAPNSHHLIQISIVEEYRIFRTINLDKNDDFVHSTNNVYLYFAVGLFLNKKTRIIDVLGVIFFLNKAIKATILPILFLCLNTVTVTAGTFEP